MQNDNPYTPPESDVVQPGNDLVNLASRWARLGGALVDGIVMILVLMPIMFLTGYLSRAMEGEQSLLEVFIFSLLGIGTFFVVNGYLLAKSGQTIGKRMAGTRIVSVETDEILPFWKVAALRYLPIQLAGLIPVIAQFIGFIDSVFVFRKDKRCIHDLIAGTKVIQASG